MSLNKPEFPTWKRENIDRFAAEAYDMLRKQSDMLEQHRQDNKDLHGILRQLLAEEFAEHEAQERKAFKVQLFKSVTKMFQEQYERFT